jgi:hypothetical protein
MGFVGQFAASRQTGARKLAASVFMLGALLAQACSIEQPVSGPVALTSEWKTIEPPEPLRVKRNEQKFCLQVGAIRNVDLQGGVVLENGQRHVLDGEAVDSEGIKYPLKPEGLRGDTVCLYRTGELPAGPDFPVSRTIIRLRLRSEPPLQVGEIRWYSYDPH